ncbi:MAG TPA: hypothetical protein VM598_02330 [Bdellovibrionota bacterium]|nr:hypothetical protein [Bdellovibrionota bacterium]
MITRYDKRKTAVEGSAAHAIAYGAEDRAEMPVLEPLRGKDLAES